MINLPSYIQRFNQQPFHGSTASPWELLRLLPEFLLSYMETLGSEYSREGDVMIHYTARIEAGVTLKGPIVVGPNCFIGAHAYLRAGVYLDTGVSIGPGCEIKCSIMFEKSAAAHFNFIGDSIVGSEVNFEAGAIIANHYNERKDKRIFIQVNGRSKDTGVQKFGALVGDGTKVGANAVLSPGTILMPDSQVGRLELVQQNPISID